MVLGRYSRWCPNGCGKTVVYHTARVKGETAFACDLCGSKWMSKKELEGANYESVKKIKIPDISVE